MYKKNILDILSLDLSEIQCILEEGLKILKDKRSKQYNDLKDKKVVSLFYEPSTRTLLSFKIAALSLSASYFDIQEKQSALMKGENIFDMMKTLESMHIDFLIVRHFQSGFAQWLASKNFNFSIITAGDGMHSHPTQALGDLLTIKEAFSGSLKNLRILFWGDILHSRVFRCLYGLLQKLEVKISLFAPPHLSPKYLENFLNLKIETSVKKALQEAQIIYPIRTQSERHFKDCGFYLDKNKFLNSYYTLSKKYSDYINKDALIFHAGPINRNIEISNSISSLENSQVWNQVTHGTIMRMALLKYLQSL